MRSCAALLLSGRCGSWAQQARSRATPLPMSKQLVRGRFNTGNVRGRFHTGNSSRALQGVNQLEPIVKADVGEVRQG